MPYESVSVNFDVFAPFAVVLSRQTPQGNLNFTANVKFNADGFAPETVEAVFQEWLDFLATSPDFPVGTSFRAATGVQNITPTP